jgi:hypothetical protein
MKGRVKQRQPSPNRADVLALTALPVVALK